MKMSINSPGESIWCPLVRESVRVREECVECSFWDGQNCLLRAVGRSRGLRAPKPLARRLRRLKPLPKGGGRGHRTPLTGEKWPRGQAAQELPVPVPESTKPPEQPVHDDPEPYKKPKRKEEDEDWDSETFQEDFPDWLETGAEVEEDEPLVSTDLTIDEPDAQEQSANSSGLTPPDPWDGLEPPPSGPGPSAPPSSDLASPSGPDAPESPLLPAENGADTLGQQ